VLGFALQLAALASATKSTSSISFGPEVDYDASELLEYIHTDNALVDKVGEIRLFASE